MTETEIERMVVRLILDNMKYQQGIEDSVKATANAAAAIEQSAGRIESFFTSTGAIATATGFALQQFGNQVNEVFRGLTERAVEYSKEFEQNMIAFEVMLGSATKATNTLNALSKFAAETPFEMPEIVKAARGLITFGEEGEQLMKTLNDVGNAAAATSTNFAMVALIFNQIRGAGKLLTQDFRQLSTRGILSLNDLAKHFKVPLIEAQKMMSDGKITFKDVQDIFASLSAEGGRFANMMERQSTSLHGRISTLHDNFGILLRTIGDQLAPAVKLGVNALISMTDTLRAMPEPLKAVTALILGLGTALGGLATFAGGALITVGALSFAFKGLSVLFVEGAAVLGVVTGVLTSFGVVVTAVWGSVVLLSGAIAAWAIWATGSWLWDLVTGTAAWNDELNKARILQLNLEDQMRKTNKEILKQVETGGWEDINSAIEQTTNNVKGYDDWIKKLNKDLAEGVLINDDLQQRMLTARETEDIKAQLIEQERLKKIQEQLLALLEARKSAMEKSDPMGPADVSLTPNVAMRVGGSFSDVQKMVTEMEKQNKVAMYSTDVQKAIALAVAEGADVNDAYIDSVFRKAAALDMERQKIEETKRLQDQFNQSTLKLQEDAMRMQLQLLGMQGTELELAMMKFEGYTDAQIQARKVLLDSMEPMKKQLDLIKQGNQIAEQFKSPADKMVEQVKALDAALAAGPGKGGITLEQYTTALEGLEKQMGKDYTVDMNFNGVDALESGSAAAMAALDEFRAGLQGPPGGLPGLPRARGGDQSGMVARADGAIGGTPEKADRIANGIEQLVNLANQLMGRTTIEIEEVGLV